MRRLMSIAAFALSLAVPVWAQHGGGGHGGGFGGGHSSGFSGGHAGGFSGGGSSHSFSGSSSVHSFSGSASHSSFSGAARFSQHGFSRDGVRIRTYGYGNGCYGYGCSWYGAGYGYPWGYGYYYPWWYDDDSSYDQSYQQNVAQAAEMNRENLAEQQMLRQEQNDGDQDAYSRPLPRAAQSDPRSGVSVVPDTVLVYRDQRKVEIQNYAIVGQTLWNFAPQHTEKIPLAQLDLPATTKANDDRGVTFRVPSAQ